MTTSWFNGFSDLNLTLSTVIGFKWVNQGGDVKSMMQSVKQSEVRGIDPIILEITAVWQFQGVQQWNNE